MNIHPIISKSREITPYYLLERKAKTGIAIYELSKSGEITPYYLLERKAKTGIAIWTIKVRRNNSILLTRNES